MMLLKLATVFLVGYSTALRIKSPPKIHTDIVLNNPYIKVVGEKLRLPCQVTGNPKPFKIWYKNNQPLSAKDERWKINRNALIIDHLELNDTAVYHCHTRNILGEKWINYTVEVKKEIKDYTDYEYYDEDSCDFDGPPTFTREKTIGYWIARSERSPVMLKCSACGYPKPTIKWYKNEQYIDPKVKKAKYKVHGYQLDIESLSIEETGNYTCILENEHGKLNFTYLLEVLMNRVMAPVIVGPTNQTVVAGSDARFECKVLSSDLQHHIQWLQHYTVNGSYRDQNGKPYVNIIQQSMPNITQPEVLIIKNVTKEEDGWYTCLISNPMGREYQSAWLTVIQFVGPSNMRIINATEDGSVYATEGHTIQLNCSVQSGTPKETITWKTGDSVLNVGGPMSLLYTFIPTRDDNLKYFTCSARNGMEIHPLEQTVQIKVAYPPKVTIEGGDEIEIREGQSLTLICTSDYDLEYVKWIRNNKTEDSALVTTAQNVSRLSIKNISRSFTGRYECQLPKRGQVGSDSVFVKVKYTPVVHITTSSLQFRTEINRPVNVSIRVQSFEMPSVLWVHSAGGKLSIWMTHSLHFDRTEEMFLLSSTITPLVQKHFGNYSFRIRNSEGSRDFKIFLLYIEPHIESYPKMKVYNTYQAIRLRCSINPKLYDGWSFSWMHFRNGVFIRSFDRPIVDNEARLNVSFVDYTDAGVYVCALLSHDANLTAQSLVFVEGPPIVAGKNMSAVRSDVGNIVVLSIQVYCYPKNISVTWFYEDRQKSVDSTEVVVSIMKMNMTNSSVTIESYGVPVQVSGYRITVSIIHINQSEGKLVCQIQNHHGIKEESFEMRDILTVFDSINKDAKHNTGSFNRMYIYGGTIALAVLGLSISICICRWLHRRQDSGVISTAITSQDNQVINIQSDTVELDEIVDHYEEIVDEELINMEQTNQQTPLYFICLPDSNISHELQKNNDDQALLKMDKYITCNTETEYINE